MTGGEEPREAAVVDLPHGQGARPSPTRPAFVGRQSELTSVTDALSQPPSWVVIEGEAGSGKTRLVHEALASPALASQRVLMASCPPLSEPFPFGPLVEALRRGRPRLDDVELSPLAGALRALFPEWADDLPPALEPLEDAHARRHRLCRALAELVEQLGVDVLVVEDAHWTDTATLEFFLLLCTSGTHGMSIVLTYRPTDVPPDSSLLRVTSALRAGMRHVRIEVAPLELEGVRELVASMFTIEEVSTEFASFLQEQTAGLPLALEESLLLLRDRRDIVRRGGEWNRRSLEELEVPPTVRDSVLERVQRLDREGRAVLSAAAVIAEPADEPLLTHVAELDETETGYGLATALGCGLLHEAGPDRFAVRHALASKAIAEAVPVSGRRRLHRRAAEALGRLDRPPLVRLARHFREAGDIAAWSHYAEAAADLAVDSGDGQAAMTMLQEVLSTPDHPRERRIRLAHKMGAAAASEATPFSEFTADVADTLREAIAEQDVEPGDRGEIRLLLGRLLVQLGEINAGYDEVEAAIPELAGRPARAACAMVYLAYPWLRTRPADRNRQWLERVSQLLPYVESDTERLSLTVNRMSASLLLGNRTGWQAAQELPQSASTTLGRQILARGLRNIAQCATVWGYYAETRRRLAQADGVVPVTQYLRGWDDARIASAHLDWYTGSWAGLAARVEELAESEGVKPATRLEARLIRGLLDLARGDRNSAEHRLHDVSEETNRTGLIDTFTLPSAALARISLADGRPGEALRITESDVESITVKGVWLWATDLAPVHLDALLGAGEPGRAEAFVERFAAGLQGRDAPAPAAALATCRAILTESTDEYTEAAAAFSRAAAAWAVLPRPYDELLARERRGRCLLAAGELQCGLAVLSRAQGRLTELGARWDADRVAHVLRHRGVEVTRSWRGGRRGYGDELSPREREVAGLVSRGLTNRQIADTLFLSPRTVDRHLSSAMRKLGVGSRTALAVAATDAGLITQEKPVT